MNLKIINGISGFPVEIERTVATIGTFDGLHLGHQAILEQLTVAAQSSGMVPLAITFEPHPRVFVTPQTPPPLLTIWEEKKKLFESYLKFGYLLVLEFNESIMNMTAEEFAVGVLVNKLKVGKLIVGYDHAFGKNRSGTINDLIVLSRKHNFALEVAGPVLVDDMPISSSRIRRLITDNRLPEAQRMLGHPYPICGKVIKGIGLGKKLGYPTANLKVNPRKLLPVEGVYACQTEIEEKMYDGMMFIGTNHFNPAAGISVEVNVFEFQESIYDREIFCYPQEYIRENRFYDDTSKLIDQIRLDKENVLKLKDRGV